jgi:DNA-binding MarR family transcriptional regulator
LGRFGGVYFKKALDSLEISTLNDMHYLNALQGKESIRKSELIQMNISDFTTGIEVINRLLKRGFVEEISDLEDKRSKRIRITDKGQVMREEMILRLSKLSEFVFGALSEDERDILLQLYKKLDLYHTALYKDFQGLSFEEIVERERIVSYS